ncbi:MAG: hypothetical protein KKA81_05090, partial [Bacteroidetes bacterium]|nr:hypothetical protein [Bacteroidota bacterium]
MKRITPPIFICVMVTLLGTCTFNKVMHSQTIVIDSTFTSDAILHPFVPSDTLYSLKISGSVQLNSDTSLVRVIVGDEDSLEFLVYESYPMISNNYNFSFSEESDETTFLDEFIPEYLKIYLINSALTISNLGSFGVFLDGLDSLQRSAKSISDSIKIYNINQYIQENGMNWIAGHTNISSLFYNTKKCLFSPKYNLFGFDYYILGVFEKYSDNYPLVENTTLVKEFSWIDHHDANSEGSLYYNEDHGWITPVQNQDTCNSCQTFASVGLLESMINLYYNYHADIDLSEGQVYNCNSPCDCNTGSSLLSVLQFIKNHGVINESCYIYENHHCDPWTFPWNPPNCNDYPDCSQEAFRIMPTDYFNLLDLYEEITDENIKRFLMDYGPCTIAVADFLDLGSHAMLLVGFEYDELKNNTIWVIKNSWGVPPPSGYGLPPDGYIRMKANLDELSHFYALETPLIAEDVILNPNPFDLKKYDKDLDGYYNWGIGNLPQGWMPPCNPSADWNDNNNRTGPCDDNFNGQYVQPEMEVYQYH